MCWELAWRAVCSGPHRRQTGGGERSYTDKTTTRFLAFSEKLSPPVDVFWFDWGRNQWNEREDDVFIQEEACALLQGGEKVKKKDELSFIIPLYLYIPVICLSTVLYIFRAVYPNLSIYWDECISFNVLISYQRLSLFLQLGSSFWTIRIFDWSSWCLSPATSLPVCVVCFQVPES